MATAKPRPCVLVVEDDDAVRRSLQILLRGSGLDVRAYGSARQALDDPMARRPACLVTDLIMPEVDGLALLAALRSDGWDGPALLISGHLTPDRRARALEIGFDQVIEKPIVDASIVECVNRAIADRASAAG